MPDRALILSRLMTRIAVTGILCLTAGCTGRVTPGQPPHTASLQQANREAEEVMALERGYWAAEQRHDSVTLGSLLAPDYVYLSSRGGTDRTKKR